MKIVTGRPPIYNRIVAVIGRPPDNSVFTWGEVLYVPHAPVGFKLELERPVVVHEETHMRQQAIMGGPEPWWDRYLRDVEFRVLQELGAYRNQYEFIIKNGAPREIRREVARHLAREFASPMYGSIIRRIDALQAITHG